ncbi:hypothetical protein PENSPDRAFT_612674 [Peniophora sp. CONT]|nr:hypothetical protein PENSPDRAFT_612674 [Peniophora sp. CONT]
MPPRKRAAERVDPETFLPELPGNVAEIFETAQSNKSSWTRNNVALHKLHTSAAQITEDVGHGKTRLVGERKFEDAVLSCVCDVLLLKKGIQVGDRANGFLAGYIEYLFIQADIEKKKLNLAEEDEYDSLGSRFAPRLLKHLRPGLKAKSIPARYRSTQLMAGILLKMKRADGGLLSELREEVLERLNDKEAAVRVQAVLAFAQICAEEHELELDEDYMPMPEIFADILAHDNSADVRRVALANIPLTPETLPHVIARTRDSDNVTRRYVYQGVFEKHIHDSDPERQGEFGETHPRVLSIAQREEILRAGLADRADGVREAASALVRAWVSVSGEKPKQEDEDGDALKAEDEEEMQEAQTAEAAGEEADQKPLPAEDPKAKALLKVQTELCAFLETFDLAAGSTDVAQSALQSVFSTDKERFAILEFNDEWWLNLTPERVFLVRVYAEYCTENKLHDRLDEALPAVTALAFHLQAAYNALLELPPPPPLDQRGEDEDEDADFAREDALFTVKELLTVAKILDYSDEAGRRRMYKLVRDMVAQEALPDELVTPSLDVLRLLCGGEKELILLIVEIIIDLRDLVKVPIEGAEALDAAADENGSAANNGPTHKSRDDMTNEECARMDAMDVRCLDLAIGMLERVNGTVDDHPSLNGLVTDFVVPSVRRHELVFREKGLHCLGLVTLISPSMAPNARKLFQAHLAPSVPGQFPPPATIKLRLLEIIVDVVMVHAQRLGTSDEGGKAIADFILQFADEDEHRDVQAKAVIGVVKLVFAGMVSEPRILGELWLQYISPHTRENHSLRQCLAYFFEKYCLASPVYQRRMMTMFIPVYKQLVRAHRDMEEDVAQYLVPLPVFVDMFTNYVNPNNAREVPGRKDDEDVHIDLASAVFRELLKPEKFGDGFDCKPEERNLLLDKSDRKILCNIFKSDKLYLSLDADDHAVRSLKLLSQQAVARRPLKDSAAANIIAKFDAKLDERYGDTQLDQFTEEDARQIEKLEDLFSFLDDLIPLDEEEEDFPIEPRKRGRAKKNARSASVATTATDEESDATVTGKGKGKAKAAKGRGKRRRLSEEDDEEESEEDDEEASRASAPPSAAPTRSMPRRAATKKVDMTPMKLEGVDEDEDEEEEDDEEATPEPKRRGQAIRSRRKASPDGSESGAESNPVVIPDTSDVEDQEVDDLLLDEEEE